MTLYLLIWTYTIGTLLVTGGLWAFWRGIATVGGAKPSWQEWTMAVFFTLLWPIAIPLGAVALLIAVWRL